MVYSRVDSQVHHSSIDRVSLSNLISFIGGCQKSAVGSAFGSFVQILSRPYYLFQNHIGSQKALWIQKPYRNRKRYCKHLYNRWACCKDSIKAYEKSCLLKTASRVQNTPYWSSELGDLRQRARKAWNYRLTDPNAHKNAIKEFAKALRSKKRSSWKNFFYFSTSVRSYHQYWSRGCKIRSWDPFSRMSTNHRAKIANSANSSINRGLADCIVIDKWGENKMGSQWIWFL
jgi:hypothetical protein